MLVAWLSQQTKSVLTLAFSLNGLTAGGMLGALLLLLWWKRGAARPVVIGMVTSLAFMSWLAGLWNPLLPESAWPPSVFWPWYTLAGTIVAVTTAMAVRSLGGGAGRSAPAAG
ncbi:MAG TPA: hypothetical protein DCY13_08630 [Verrucomicrobiales bacterium]|nr:hypothetical protein [Verrucomicrobiales bacterium]